MRALRGIVVLFGLLVASSVCYAQTSPTPGAWTGTVMQNAGTTNYTVIMTITASGAQTDYPELKCGGSLKQAGAANGYVFYVETITRGGKSTGGRCIDGTVTVASNGNGMSWGWVGTYGGKVYVGWSDLVRK